MIKTPDSLKVICHCVLGFINFCPFRTKIIDLKGNSLLQYCRKKKKRLKQELKVILINYVLVANKHNTDIWKIIIIWWIFTKCFFFNVCSWDICMFSIKCSPQNNWIFLNASNDNFLHSKRLSYIPNLCQWKQTRKPTSQWQ